MDIPLKEVKVEAMKGTIESLIASNPNKKWTLRDLAKSTSSGKFKCKKSHLNHILTKKSTKRKRGLRSPDIVDKVDTPAVKKLLPYS